ncbi:MAG: AIM24 family protein [Bacteroidales bacterium]|jgi:uncharacterized protein (AIM24 family)|nr:AIM24 family protein [Bacteroidales bacterium]
MNCKVIGYDFKSLEVQLQPSERFFCERGALIYHEGGIEKNVKVIDKGITGILKRTLSGESMFLVELLNTSPAVRKLMVAGKMGLLPVELKLFPNGIICRKGFYIASSKEVDIDFSLNMSSFISGTGLIMQKITGEGTVFLDSVGSAICLDVPHGDSVFVDEKSFLCMDGNAQNRMSSSFSGRGLLGGEGLSMFQIGGPAKIYVNSVNVK